MATSIAFLGNAVYELQQADVIGYHPLVGWPRLPIYLAQATGYYPTRETVVRPGRAARGVPARRALDVRGRARRCSGRRGPPRPRRRPTRRRREPSREPAGAGPLLTRSVTVRVGVDVGGTFTKAVAFDLDANEIVARAVVPTSHDRGRGRGRRRARRGAQVVADDGRRPHRARHPLHDAGGQRAARGRRRHGRRDRARAPARPAQDRASAPGSRRSSWRRASRSRTVHEVLDVTDGLDRGAAAAAIERLRAAGASAICVAEAFSPDDDTNENAVADARRRAGSAGVHVERAERPLRAGAAHRHGGDQRVDHPDRARRPPTSSSAASPTSASRARSW